MFAAIFGSRDTMARVTRATKPQETPTPTKPATSPSDSTPTSPKKADIPLKSVERRQRGPQSETRKKRQHARAAARTRKKRQEAIDSLDPAQRVAARATIHKPWTPRATDPEDVSGLKKLVRKQMEEIEQLKKQAGSGAEQAQSPETVTPKSATPKTRGGRRGRSGGIA